MTGFNDAVDNASGGESYPALEFKNVGDKAIGEIVRLPNKKVAGKADMPDSWPVTMKVNGELRTLWVNEDSILLGALRQAQEDVGPGTKLQVGGEIGVKLVEKRDTGKPKPANIFKCVYKPPVQSASVDDIFGGDDASAAGEDDEF